MTTGSRSSTTGWGTCARSRRRSSASGPRRVVTSDPEAVARCRRADPARGRRVREGDGADRRARAGRADRRAARGGHAGARDLPRLPAAVRVVDRARRRRAAWACSRARSPGSTPPGLKVPHIGWEPVALGAARRRSPRGSSRTTPFYFVHGFAPRPPRGEDVLGTRRPRRALRLRGRAPAALRRPVPPREVERRGPAPARQLRRRSAPSGSAGVILYPAIDIRGGRAVRLRPGRLRARDGVRRRPASTRRGAGSTRARRRCTSSTSTGRAAGAPVNIEHVRADLRGGRRARSRSAAACARPSDVEAVLDGRAPRGSCSAPRRSRDPALVEALAAEHGERDRGRGRRPRAARSRSRAGSARRRAAPRTSIADLGRRGVRRFVFTPVEVDGTLAGPGARRRCARSPRPPRRPRRARLLRRHRHASTHLRELAGARPRARSRA